MSGIATPQEVQIAHDGQMVVISIQGAGTLRVPPDIAHWMARKLIEQSNALDDIIGKLPLIPLKH